jgi:hypothetical protein
MTVAILNPGPSLAALEKPPAADVLIGVNRAALRFECTCWAATDYPMIKRHQAAVLGTPALLTRRQTWADIGARCRLPLDRVVESIDIPNAPPWALKSMTCAMAFAFANGASRIDLYGCDWSGEQDFDGVKAGEDRSEKRWAAEQADFAALSRWMLERGVMVARHWTVTSPCKRSAPHTAYPPPASGA